MGEWKRKKKRVLSRPKAALRAVVLAVAAVLLLNVVFHTGFLFPRQAVRAEEKRNGLYGPTTVLRCARDERLGPAARVYLTANGDGVGVFWTRLTWSGWVASGKVIECGENERENVAVYDVMPRDGTRCGFVFGCVNDPEVASLRYWELLEGERTASETMVEEFTEYHDRRYFLFDASFVMQTVERSLDTLDAQGRVLEEKLL